MKPDDPLAGSWALAESEERLGDALFFAGEPGSAPHYQAAQRALVPLGALFSSREESERRMEAYGRLVNKLYAIAPDGTPRPGHDAQPTPGFPPLAIAGQIWTRQQSELGRLHQYGGHWRHLDLGGLWLDAARALAAGHPTEADGACQWSLGHFELYSKDWSAHLPASRWDADGSDEMEEVRKLKGSLALTGEQRPPPDWVSLLLDGDWQAALAAFPDAPPEPEFQPLAVLLADACQTAGKEDAAQQIQARLS